MLKIHMVKTAIATVWQILGDDGKAVAHFSSLDGFTEEHAQAFINKATATKSYTEGEKVVFTPDGKTYDFGYYSATPGRCVIYQENEMNMQDSFVTDLENIRPIGES